MTYSLEDRQRTQADLNLDSLPDDEFMDLAAQVKAAAVSPRRTSSRGRGTSPDALEATVAEATVGRLLEKAKLAAHRSNAEMASRLGVSRQRIAEILTSRNLKFGTFVTAASVLGYETRISLHPIDNSGPDLEAVLPSAEFAHQE